MAESELNTPTMLVEEYSRKGGSSQSVMIGIDN